MKHTGTIHIFGQTDAHNGAAIVGDVGGLMALRHALDNALSSYPYGKPVAATYTNDGEGYVVTVVCRANMARVPVPYAGYHVDWPKWLRKLLA